MSAGATVALRKAAYGTKGDGLEPGRSAGGEVLEIEGRVCRQFGSERGCGTVDGRGDVCGGGERAAKGALEVAHAAMAVAIR